jgi:parallel beta-helix repeat protein
LGNFIRKYELDKGTSVGPWALEGCDIFDNKEDGVLLRGGASGVIAGNTIANNGRFGIELVDCTG